MTVEQFLILVGAFAIMVTMMAVGYHVFAGLGSWLKNKFQKRTIICLNCGKKRVPDKVFPLYCTSCRNYGLKYRTLINLDALMEEAKHGEE